jgi:hypothetical protein
MKSLKFIGDFKKLKDMGFDFHKSSANNKITYSKEHIFIYKSQKEVKSTTFLHLDLIYELLLPYFKQKDFSLDSLIEKNEKLDKMFGRTSFINFYFHSDGFVTLDKTEYTEAEKTRWQLFAKLHDDTKNLGTMQATVPDTPWQRITAPIVDLETIKELHDYNMLDIEDI